MGVLLFVGIVSFVIMIITMNKPELSIIIPAYNCAISVTQIVNSILRQDFKDFELIIVNDYSTDNTLDILKKLAKTDRRIKVVDQPKNGGASAARNAGIAKAHGKYIMFFDADDDISNKALSTFVNTIKKPNIELAASGFTSVTIKNKKILNSVDVCTNKLPDQRDNESWRIYILRLLGLDGRLYQVWNKIYLSKIIKDNHLKFQEGINFGEDLLFNLDYFAHMSGKISFIPKALYIYYQSLDAGTFSKSSLIYSNRLQNYKAVLDFINSEPSSDNKDSLLIWLKYNWIYSHLLAISSSNLPHKQKIAKIKEVNQIEAKCEYSSVDIIGRKRYQIEKFLHTIIQRPQLCLATLKLLTFAKQNRVTAKLWQSLRRNINT